MESIKNIQEEIIRLSEAIARLAQGDTQNSELQNELKLLSQDLLERVHLLKFAHQVFDDVEPESEIEEQEEFISEPIENIEQQILDEDQHEDEIERFDDDEESIEEEPEEIEAAVQFENQEKQEEQEQQESQEEQEDQEERENEVEELEEEDNLEDYSEEFEPASQEEAEEEIEEVTSSKEPEFEEPQPQIGSSSSDDKESLNDKISKLSKSDSLASKLQNQPIQNLKTAIGLNERFLFANELFQGDGAEYQRAIEEFNHLASMDDAVRLIEHKYQPNYKWDFDNHTVQNFIHYLQRRYSYRESA